MRKLLLLLTAVLFITASCKSDDDLQDVIDVINADYDKDIQPGELKLDAEFTVEESLDPILNNEKNTTLSKIKYELNSQMMRKPLNFKDSLGIKMHRAFLKRINQLEIQEPNEIDFSVYTHIYKTTEAVETDYYFLDKDNRIIGMLDENVMSHFKYGMFESSIDPYFLAIWMALGDENLYELEINYHKSQGDYID